MTTFALVHGAWHGAWCWERLLAPLSPIELDAGHFPMISEPEALADALDAVSSRP